MTKDSNKNRRRGRPKKSEQQDAADKAPVVALDRGLRVLVHLADSHGATLTEVSVAIGAPVATVHRILATLELRGMAEFSQKENRWFVGPQSFSVGNAYLDRSNLSEIAKPVLQRLAEETGETANLGIETDGELVYLLQVESQNPIRASFKTGSSGNIHCSGIGKAILAHMDKSRVDEIIAERGLSKLTAKTICDAGQLVAELRQVRRQGWAIDDEERSAGMRCVAAPIYNMVDAVVAGVSVSGPTHRFGDERLEEIAREVMHSAHLISTGLGDSSQ